MFTKYSKYIKDMGGNEEKMNNRSQSSGKNPSQSPSPGQLDVTLAAMSDGVAFLMLLNTLKNKTSLLDCLKSEMAARELVIEDFKKQREKHHADFSVLEMTCKGLELYSKKQDEELLSLQKEIKKQQQMIKNKKKTSKNSKKTKITNRPPELSQKEKEQYASSQQEDSQFENEILEAEGLALVMQEQREAELQAQAEVMQAAAEQEQIAEKIAAEEEAAQEAAAATARIVVQEEAAAIAQVTTEAVEEINHSDDEKIIASSIVDNSEDDTFSLAHFSEEDVLDECKRKRKQEPYVIVEDSEEELNELSESPSKEEVDIPLVNIVPMLEQKPVRKYPSYDPAVDDYNPAVDDCSSSEESGKSEVSQKKRVIKRKRDLHNQTASSSDLLSVSIFKSTQSANENNNIDEDKIIEIGESFHPFGM